MVKIRSIEARELEAFARASLDPAPESVQGFMETARQMWAKGSSRPGWFFLAERDGRPVGRAAYWRLRARPQDFFLMTLQVLSEEDPLSVGLPLLLESWESLKAAGAQSVSRRLDRSWESWEEQREMLEHAGMSLLQKKQVFLWGPGGPVEAPERLAYRSYAQVGERAFVEAIRRVTAGTRDREIQALGGPQAAAVLLEILQEDARFHPEWAQLAFDRQGSLAGLVAPVGALEAQEEGSIAYIGVVPEQRGRGSIHDLLLKGMAILQAARMRQAYAETDLQNTGMLRAFERAGWRPLTRIELWRKQI